MIGLITKDFIMLKKKVSLIKRIFILITITAALCSLRSAGAISIAIALPMFSFVVPTTLLISDEQNHWNKYAIAMPVRKMDIVKSRYAFCVLLLLACSLFALVVGTVASILFGEYTIQTVLFITLIGFFFAGFCLSCSLGTSYVFGINGSSAASIILMAVFMGASFLLKGKMENLKGLVETNGSLIAVIGIVAIFVIFVVSMKISIIAFSKKHS